MALRAYNFRPVFDRESLGHRNYSRVGLIGFKIRQSFAGADLTSEVCLACHIDGSFGLIDRSYDQAIARDPSRIPAFEGRSANFTLEAANLARLCHGFRAPIDRAAFAGPMAAL